MDAFHVAAFLQYFLFFDMFLHLISTAVVSKLFYKICADYCYLLIVKHDAPRESLKLQLRNKKCINLHDITGTHQRPPMTDPLFTNFGRWCGPCKMMSETLEVVGPKMKDEIRIFKVK